MRAVLAWVFGAELSAALHLTTVGEWWAARAARRYGRVSGGKFSGISSPPLKSADPAPSRSDDGVAFDWIDSRIDRRMNREAK